MKDKGLKTKLSFSFNFDEEVPIKDIEVDFNVKENKKTKIEIVTSKKKKYARDSSTSLF